jgi:putative aldouronate transport system substrate-binding protein
MTVGLASYTPLVFQYESKNPVISSELDAPYADAFRQAAMLVKSWHDAGYLNDNPFGNTVRSRDSFQQGKSAVGLGNSQDIQGTLAAAAANGWQVEIIPVLASDGTAMGDPYINNGVAIGARSKNWQRAMQFLDLIMEDKAYDYLVYFGIEGKNYVLTSDGKIGLPPGVTADTNTYPPDAAGFWFTNKDLFLPLTTWSDDYLALKNKVKSMLYDSPYAAFTFTPDNVKTEYANVTQTYQQYALPLFVGLQSNVDGGIATLKDKLQAAGLQKVTDEANKQIQAYTSGLGS